MTAQERPSGKPSTPEIGDEARKQAVALLQSHARASRAVDVLTADYEQLRTTSLSTKPLRSSGRFTFVRRPACVLFRASKPRRSIVRLTASKYEVYRPSRKRLERFPLRGADLAGGLFAAIGGDAERLLREFDVVGFEAPEPAAAGGAAQSVIRLRPRAKATRERLRELVITLVTSGAEAAGKESGKGGSDKRPGRQVPAKRGESAKRGKPDGAQERVVAAVSLRAVAYRDASGDLIEIRLANVRSNPKQRPSTSLDVAKGTKVIEHEAR